MRTKLLPDGTAATTPIYAGLAPIPMTCPSDDDHDWLTHFRKDKLDPPVEVGGKTFRSIAMELCQKCNWCRAHLYQEDL